jgi:hypothetical protein
LPPPSLRGLWFSPFMYMMYKFLAPLRVELKAM